MGVLGNPYEVPQLSSSRPPSLGDAGCRAVPVSKGSSAGFSVPKGRGVDSVCSGTKVKTSGQNGLP